MFIKIVVIVLLIFLFPGLSDAAIFYKWVDNNGEISYTDDPSKIPEEYREQVGLIREKTSQDVKHDKNETDKPEKSIRKPVDSPEDKKQMKGGVSPSDPNAVDLAGEIKLEVTKEKTVRLSGRAVNRTNLKFNDVTITIKLFGKDGKNIRERIIPVSGIEGEGRLKPGETGSFNLPSQIPSSLLKRYEYVFNWKFTTTVKE